MAHHIDPENSQQSTQFEQLLLEYTRSYSRYYSRSESKLMQRCREQLFQEREMGTLVDRLEWLYGRLEGCKVLEVGSGSGSRSVAVALRGADVTGIEPSEAGVAASRLRAQRYPNLQVRFEVGIGEKLPFPDGSFDLVFSTEVLQHVQGIEQVISETSRVLRPGGHCYHEAPNNLYPREFHYRMLWFPGMPKSLGKLYARLRGKDPRHLDDINFIYPRHLAGVMRRHSFSEIQDLYEVEFWQKTTETERIRSRSKRRVFELLRRCGLSRPVARIVGFLGIYPQVKIHAVKKV